jgi:hypothetical protein
MVVAVCVAVFMTLMHVSVVMGMTLCMIMAVAAALPAFLRSEVIRPAPQGYHGVSTGNTAAPVPLKAEFPAAQAKLTQLCTKGIGVNPQVYQSPQSHVTGDTGEAVKV